MKARVGHWNDHLEFTTPNYVIKPSETAAAQPSELQLEAAESDFKVMKVGGIWLDWVFPWQNLEGRTMDVSSQVWSHLPPKMLHF